jgi:hypothetical protein
VLLVEPRVELAQLRGVVERRVLQLLRGDVVLVDDHRDLLSSSSVQSR